MQTIDKSKSVTKQTFNEGSPVKTTDNLFSRNAQWIPSFNLPDNALARTFSFGIQTSSLQSQRSEEIQKYFRKSKREAHQVDPILKSSKASSKKDQAIKIEVQGIFKETEEFSECDLLQIEDTLSSEEKVFNKQEHKLLRYKSSVVQDVDDFIIAGIIKMPKGKDVDIHPNDEIQSDENLYVSTLANTQQAGLFMKTSEFRGFQKYPEQLKQSSVVKTQEIVSEPVDKNWGLKYQNNISAKIKLQGSLKIQSHSKQGQYNECYVILWKNELKVLDVKTWDIVARVPILQIQEVSSKSAHQFEVLTVMSNNIQVPSIELDEKQQMDNLRRNTETVPQSYVNMKNRKPILQVVKQKSTLLTTDSNLDSDIKSERSYNHDITNPNKLVFIAPSKNLKDKWLQKIQKQINKNISMEEKPNKFVMQSQAIQSFDKSKQFYDSFIKDKPKQGGFGFNVCCSSAPIRGIPNQ